MTNRYRIGYSSGLTLVRLILFGALTIAAAGCGATGGSSVVGIERTFPINWADHADAVKIDYTATGLRLHDGRWTANVSVENRSGGPLYETTWAPQGDFGSTWNGPALVYSGLDVLGDRRLIFLPADREEPSIPYPLQNGKSWHGTISGKLQAKPVIPHGQPIWVRYPMFGIGRPWDNVTAATAVGWISEKSVKL